MPKKIQLPKYVEGIGKRKSAVSRVRIFEVKKSEPVSFGGIKINSGDIFVNLKPIKEVFPSAVDQSIALKPLTTVDALNSFAISVIVKGGGHKGRVESIAHGISKALLKVDDKYRPLLKAQGLLTRDPRVKERRKVGTGGKARRKKQSPKR
ncbi:MAG: 30S ribosomal protein S9 [Patescibacteria group bacterium]